MNWSALHPAVAGKNFNRPVETCLVAAAVYFGICFSLSMLVRRLQQRIAIVRQGSR